MLAACRPKAILARMLRNLKAIYHRSDDLVRALRIADLLLAIDPRDGAFLRDRGRLYAAMDCYALAARDFETCLELGTGSDESALRAEIAGLRHKAKYLN
jgi:regulator of sirC expression with transglutaminase-like and TPR domain